MTMLLIFALKSLLIAGLTLAILHALRARSAAERSWIAHLGLLALLLLPIGELLLPRLSLEAPALTAAVPPLHAHAPAAAADAAPATIPLPAALPAIDWSLVAYGLPLLALLGVTLLALLRLFALRAKAHVLVEPTWLTALAHAQRRMGFKHGTALLTSNERRSPISWGVLRPVILLNEEALEATGEAEAIIAHELAHVARFDWAKLLLARIVTALFWFNPLVWLLAREAHQLREETADDAVLAASIADTDYAQLLVGVARHDCRGFLLGAHGVAPSRDSLKRRVRRVLDATTTRGPAARGFAAGVVLGAIAFAAPLAALTFTTRRADQPAPSLPRAVASAVAEASRRSSVVAGTAVATTIHQGRLPTEDEIDRAVEAASVARDQALDAAATAREEALAQAGHARDQALAAAARARGAALAQAGRTRELVLLHQGQDDAAADRPWALAPMGVSDDYARSLRALLPQARLSTGQLVALNSLGVTPNYIRDLAAAGFAAPTVSDLLQARALGVTAASAARLRQKAGRPLTLAEVARMQAMGDRDLAHLPIAPPVLPEWIRKGAMPPGVPAPPDPPGADF